MPETFEMFRYLDHLRRRWRVIAVACGVAVVLALVVALLTPARYTATARIMIEPPAGSDSRIAIAVSPIYLESLKSYELVASGDRLFLEAVEHSRSSTPSPWTRLKRSVLRVTHSAQYQDPRNCRHTSRSCSGAGARSIHRPANRQGNARSRAGHRERSLAMTPKSNWRKRAPAWSRPSMPGRAFPSSAAERDGDHVAQVGRGASGARSGARIVRRRRETIG